MACVVILFMSSLPQNLVAGNDGYVVISMSDKCRESWWRSFLLIQNFGEIVHIVSPHLRLLYTLNCHFELFPFQCLNHTWYLAVDFQLFLITPIFVYVLWLLGRKFAFCIAGMIFLLECWSFHQLYK